MTETKPHHGRNIKRFREWAGIKQDALAAELNWSQQKVSLLEQKEEIEDDILEEVAKILKVPAVALKNMDDQAAINIISNTFSDFNDNAIASAMNYQCSFNPIDKIVQLYEEKIVLYERMLKDKSDMIEKLEEFLLKGKA
jgi:transcriptional regulator with XRE-family HTH domain